MSSTSKEPDASEEIGNNSPVLHPESPSNPLSARLQEDYSELLRYAVGMQGLDRRTFESSDQTFQPVSRSVGSSARQTPIDQQQEWESALKTQGNDGTGNFNTNAVHSSQPQKFRKHASTGATNTNVNKDSNSDDDDDEEIHENTSTLTSRAVTSSHATFLEPALTCLCSKLDSWLGKLKCDIVNEFRHLTVHALESQKCSHRKEIKETKCKQQKLEKEVNRLNEMINTCEQSMSRKDTVIDNVTQALGKQRDKVTLAQAFYHTRAENAEAKREKFTESLADQHNIRRLREKVFRSWYGLIQKNWKCKLEQVCNKKAQDICKQLSIDYEDKIKTLNEEIENLSRKLKCLQCEREQYALQVKKAFMRGVCALNMETMSAFTHEEAQNSPDSVDTEVEDNTNTSNLMSNFPEKDDPQIKHVPADIIHDLDGGHFSSMAVVGTGQQVKFKPQKGKVRPSTAPSVSSSYPTRAWGISHTLAPPMASVVVERHDPVTKQTVGKATASRYPKYNTSKNSSCPMKHKQGIQSSVSRSMPVSQVFQTFQPVAGQSSNSTAPGIKVVE